MGTSNLKGEVMLPVIHGLSVCARDSGPSSQRSGGPTDRVRGKVSDRVGQNSESRRTIAPKAWPITNIRIARSLRLQGYSHSGLSDDQKRTQGKVSNRTRRNARASLPGRTVSESTAGSRTIGRRPCTGREHRNASDPTCKVGRKVGGPCGLRMVCAVLDSV